MERMRPVVGPLLAGLLWCLLALATLQLRSHHSAVIILWLPSAVAVATLHASEKRRWPAMLTGIFFAQLLTSLIADIDLFNSMFFGVATIAEAYICAHIGITALGGRGQLPRSFRQIAGLFLAAVAGAIASALISFPFRLDPTLPELAWWFLASVLGILTGTPLFLYLRQKLDVGHKGIIIADLKSKAGLVAVSVAMVVLGWFVLSFEAVSLTALLVVGIAAIAVRYGQLGAALGILAFALAATFKSLGGQTPTAFLDFTPFNAGLYLQALMLVMLAASLPLAALLLSRDLLEKALRDRNQALHDNLTIFDLAEGLAGIGRWRYDLRTGAQEWSARMLELNGLPATLSPDPGDVRDKLPDKGKELFSQIARNSTAREPYSFHCRVAPEGKQERTLHMSVLNEFDDAGERIALFAVAMDVTEQVQREEALDLARSRAMQLAAEAQKLANTDPLTGLANRRSTLRRLKRLVDQAHHRELPLTAVMIDVDHFKQINDGFGHKTGDDVLVRIAELAQAQVRSGDLIGRIGGEEFVWLLPEVDDEAAGQLAERLRSAIEDSSGMGGLPRVTASIGLASLQAGDDAERILVRADEALYAAKEAGRNRVRLAA